MGVVKKVKKFIEKKMSKLEDCHSFDHIERAYKTAIYLAKKERADMEIVKLSALLHDVGRAIKEPHNKTGAKFASQLLEKMNYPKEKRDKVFNIILNHPLYSRQKIKTLEEKIIFDADKIDLIGIIGVVRLFYFLGTEKMPFKEIVNKWRNEWKDIYKLLNLESSKKIAKRRYKETLKIISSLEKEIMLKDLKF